jgi:hypothetical protein
MPTTVTRIWHGITRVKHANEYLDYVVKTGIKDYRSIQGNLGAEILRRIDGATFHFWTVTRREGFESIKKFAGEDYEKARYYAEDKKFLLEFEPTVVHCETFAY